MADDIHDLYQAKLCTADAAVGMLANDTDVAMGMAVAEPPALLRAIAESVENGSLADLRVWYFHSMSSAGETILRSDLLGRVRPHCMFLSAIERQILKEGGAAAEAIQFVPTSFSESPRLLTENVALDACLTMVSPMDSHGFFTFGTSNDYTSSAARVARKLIVEVNRNMPRVFGESQLHVSEVDAIVEHNAPLLEANAPAFSQEDAIIAALIAELIDDRSGLQMGIGSLAAAVCEQIGNRSDLGIHTELMTPALAELVQSGAVSNRYKATFPGRSVFTFALGHRAFYEWLSDNQAVYSLPVNLVNDPRHIAKNDRVVSVNSTIQVDLGGACNSEHLFGHQYSGAGGQLDFVRGANASNGGLSIIACRSTAKQGAVSRIVPKLDGPVTTPRNDVHTIVTEYGRAELRGKTLRQRAEAMIAIAHPRFRDELAKSV